MRSLKLVVVAVLCLSLVGLSGVFTTAQEKGEPKYTTKEVMKEAMKGGLCKTVGSGKGTKEDAAKLVELFTALGGNKPPKGDAASWKEKTGALVAAAKAVAAGEKGAGAKLVKAANCKACHDDHK